MLHCNMINSIDIQLGLEDLLADLHHARKHDQLGRLAFLAYCEVKGWARRAGKSDVADAALRMFSHNPCISKSEFLAGIDGLISTLELHESEYQRINDNCTGTSTLFPTKINNSANKHLAPKLGLPAIGRPTSRTLDSAHSIR
jgi:hypothetical protein